MELKKPTTYDQQVELLKNKGIVIENEESCKRFLSRVNYYHFSGYVLPYMNRKENKCREQIGFESLLGVYNFDVELRNLVAITVERIELYIRTTISNYHVLKYGAEGYIDPNTFGNKHNAAKFSSVIEKCISDHRNTAIVKHHYDKYDGHFPLWVMVEFMPIGSLSYFYGDMKNEDKKSIAQSTYQVNYQTLDSWMRCITDLRNKCAHCSRLYYWTFSAVPKIPKRANYVADRRLFSQLLMLKMMYPYPENWNKDFVDKFERLLLQYAQVISYEHIGLPEDWKDRLINR